jgi:hypothetical protein
MPWDRYPRQPHGRQGAPSNSRWFWIRDQLGVRFRQRGIKARRPEVRAVECQTTPSRPRSADSGVGREPRQGATKDPTRDRSNLLPLEV